MTTSEDRIVEGISNNKYFYRLKLEQRYQAEQRWSAGKYSNRFRYRLTAYIPINHTKVEKQTWFIAASEEIFLNNRPPNFQRNRLTAALGYQFSKTLILQAGWINQYDHPLEGSTTKNYAAFTAIYRIHRKNAAEREYMPSNIN